MSRKLRRAVLAEFERSPMPLSLASLGKRLGLQGYAPDELAGVLAELVSGGQVGPAEASDSAGDRTFRILAYSDRRAGSIERIVRGGGSGLSDVQEAQFHALDRQVLDELQDDVRFFRAHPLRLHRVRAAFPIEAKQAAVIRALPTGLLNVVAVQRIPGGQQLRAFIPSVQEPPLDIPEDWAAAIFSLASIQAQFGRREAAGILGDCFDALRAGVVR